jgi:protein FRG1
VILHDIIKMPVKPLSFKGDKKPSKKRKHRADEDNLPADSKALVHAPDEAADPTAEDETWTTPDAPTDLSGPVVLILPTSPLTCLGADAHGNVFASLLENIVENVPETAEPHDVRQVWVASSVAGTGELSFKGSHGGYLSCDSLGVLGAQREARGAEEGFVIEHGDVDGKTRWKLRTAASKRNEGEKGLRYVCAVADEKTAAKSVSISLRGDGEAGLGSTQLVVKMQARFKPRLQQKKETKAKEKISRKELEQAVGRRLDDEEVKRLKRARKEGNFYEEVLDVRVKGKHDKFAS